MHSIVIFLICFSDSFSFIIVHYYSVDVVVVLVHFVLIVKLSRILIICNIVSFLIQYFVSIYPCVVVLFEVTFF